MRRTTLHPFTMAGMLALTLLAAALPASAGPYTRIQILLPGETAAPGTTTGKTGTPLGQTAGVPFDITVRACDSNWSTVTTVTDAIQILCTDQSASLPGSAQLVSGQRIYTVTLNAAGSFTFQAHDQTDNTIPDGVSAAVSSLVLQGFTFSSISQKNQSAGVPLNVTITAIDPQGRTVTGFSGSVALKEITSYGDGRTSPATVTFTNGHWSGGVACYRADETSINRGNVNLYAYLANAPSKNGTSDPFTVHPGGFRRVQIVVPGQTPLPGSVSGVTGSPASQSASQPFNATVYSTDDYWNPVVSGDQVRITSSDPQFTPATGTLSGGSRAISVTLKTVGTQTLTVNDQTNGSITGMTSPGITVLPSGAHHFAFNTITSPVTAGVPVAVTVRAVDSGGNTVPNYSSDCLLLANTGAGSITPELITFTNGVWTGAITFKGAGGSVTVTCADFSSPPHTGTSNSFVVNSGPFAGLQVLLPGETARGGTADGKDGTPTNQTAGTAFTLTVRAVDAYWNLVSGINDHVALASDDQFAGMPGDTTLANGQILLPVRLFKSGQSRIWASDATTPAMRPDTSSWVTVIGGSFSRVLVLAPGESPAPGTATGRTGTATAQSINYHFTVTVLATDPWWNPVTGVSDRVHLSSSTDANAQFQADTNMVNGRADMTALLTTGGYQLITVNDVTNPAKTGSSTQVSAISSGFHLQASIAQSTAKAGEPFTLTVKVTNDAGSVIQEVNSFVTVEVQSASTPGQPGRGTLLLTQFQLLQGQRSVSETYTFSEPIVLVVHDDAGNAPGITSQITIVPGNAAALKLSSAPTWVGGNKHSTISGLLADQFDNGIPGQLVVFRLLSGSGVVSPADSVTSASGIATADFLSPRLPEHDVVRGTSNGFTTDLDVEVAFVNPGAPGGTVTNYPNPFHPPAEGTVVAYKLADNATVTIRIFSSSGDLVRELTFPSGGTGGATGLNQWTWDGRNGAGNVVASGGYVALVEAQGVGQTLHVMRRKIAVVR